MHFSGTSACSGLTQEPIEGFLTDILARYSDVESNIVDLPLISPVFVQRVTVCISVEIGISSISDKKPLYMMVSPFHDE